MPRTGARTGSIGGRGSARGARVVGGGNGRRQTIIGRSSTLRQGRHAGMARGTKRVGG